MTFEQELTELLNRHSIENDSNTPDFILAKYLLSCLETWNRVIELRDRWNVSDKMLKQLVKSEANSP